MESNVKWYIPKDCKVAMKKKYRHKFSQEVLALMNGKSVKFNIDLSNWKMVIGGCA